MPRPDNWPRTILHVDIDAFYTSVHQRDDPKLRGVPVAVAGRSRRAVVMGASYEARAFGVRSAMPLHEALLLCPQLVVVSPDGSRYRDASRLIHQIFRRFTSPELVEGVSLDEAYLDATAPTRPATPNATAAPPPTTLHTPPQLSGAQRRERRPRTGPARRSAARADRSRGRAAQGRRRARAHDLREAQAPRLQAGEPPGEPDEPDRRRRDDLPGRAFGAGEVARRVAAGALDRGWAVWPRAP